MKKFFDLSEIKLNEQGKVEGNNIEEIRELANHEIKSVSGGNNYTFACDGNSPPNDNCFNFYSCPEEVNSGDCTNAQNCESGSNTISCTNGFCDDAANGPLCHNA